MNERAEEHGLIVLYPHQPRSANSHLCWNWFRPAHQKRGGGEPALLADLTRKIMTEHNLARERVFLAGLSAGGAMAAILAAEYPEIFAAVGIHSGLPPQAARNVLSALAVMKGLTRPRAGPPVTLPTIIFHGDRDQVVHPSNGQAILRDRKPSGSTEHRVPEGFTSTVTHYAEARSEHWLVRGAGHGWSGGDPRGTYTIPQGPDATREMLRFFLE